MRKNVFALLSLTLLMLAGCNSADQKIPEMASDFCNCFSGMQKNLSSKTKQIMQTAANSADPTRTIKDEVGKLDDEEKKTVGEEFASFGEIDNPDSKIGRCMADVEKKYGSAKTMNETKFLQKLIAELESKQGCDFTAALLKLGLKAKEKEKGN
jgi:outer membrane murein-binding lipoprotein Lpp